MQSKLKTNSKKKAPKLKNSSSSSFSQHRGPKDKLLKSYEIVDNLSEHHIKEENDGKF